MKPASIWRGTLKALRWGWALLALGMGLFYAKEAAVDFFDGIGMVMAVPNLTFTMFLMEAAQELPELLLLAATALLMATAICLMLPAHRAWKTALTLSVLLAAASLMLPHVELKMRPWNVPGTQTWIATACGDILWLGLGCVVVLVVSRWALFPPRQGQAPATNAGIAASEPAATE